MFFVGVKIEIVYEAAYALFEFVMGIVAGC